jgi:hypothetical protein
VRRGISIVIVAATLAVPAMASAASRTYVGNVSGDTSGTASFTFKADGHVSKKGKFVPRGVKGFTATVPFSCFDTAGNQISTSTRSDLSFGALGVTLVRKHGGFAKGPVGTPQSVTVSGTLKKGRGSGTVSVTQGVKGTAGYCSTGTYADPSVAWTAKLVPLACAGAELGPRPLCTGPPRS